MRGTVVSPPSDFGGVLQYQVESGDFRIKTTDGHKRKVANLPQKTHKQWVKCLPDEDIEQGDTVMFKSLFPREGPIKYVHEVVIVKHIRSAESDLPVLPYVPFGAG